jgi:hypothetical protein
MDASPSSPRSGESVSENSAVDWETLGRQLLAGELERQAFALRDQYLRLAKQVKNGEEIGVEELAQLYSSDRKVLIKSIETAMEVSQDQ